MKIKLIFLWVILTIFVVTPAYAKLNIVTTLPWIGSLVKEIGQDKVNLKVLVKATQDPHYVEAKPSMILTIRKANILLFNGLDLEIGYLPVLIESSRNPKIQAGTEGYVDCSKFIEVIDRPTQVDRSMGDVHPYGNPHYHFSPKNIKKVAIGIAGVFAQADPQNADIFKKNSSVFVAKLQQKEVAWGKNDLKGKKIVAYHKLFEYLAHEFDFTIIGYIEPKPGIPPSAGHVKRLIDKIKANNVNTIITTTTYPQKEADYIATKTNAQVLVMPHDVGSMKGIDTWFDLMDTVLMKLQ